MDLYFSPMTCSLATRMAIVYAGLEEETRFHRVQLADKRLEDGTSYLDINPKGQVAALRTREGELLTENCAILQYVADLAPESGLAPPAGTFARVRLQEWLSFVASEVHKNVFYSIFHPQSPEAARSFARDTLAPPKFTYLNEFLQDRQFLLDQFSVADAYLATTLNWCANAGLDLKLWPSLRAYHKRVSQLDAVARATSAEMALWTAA